MELTPSDMKALSSDSRVAILKALKDRRKTLSELSEELRLAPPTTKEHLQLLVESQLIQMNDEGRKWKYYSLTRKGKGLVAPSTPFFSILLSSAVLIIGAVGLMFALVAPSLVFGAMELGAKPASYGLPDVTQTPGFAGEGADRHNGSASAPLALPSPEASPQHEEEASKALHEQEYCANSVLPLVSAVLLIAGVIGIAYSRKMGKPPVDLWQKK